MKEIKPLINDNTDRHKNRLAEVAKNSASAMPASQGNPINLKFAKKISKYGLGGIAAGGILFGLGYLIMESVRRNIIVYSAPLVKTVYDSEQHTLLEYFRCEDVKRNGFMWDNYNDREKI